MDIKYKITEYFEKNHLFDDTTSDGLKISNNKDSIIISGNSRDLIYLADIIVNIVMDNNNNSHIHIDNLTILNKKSDYKEIIINKDIRDN